MTCNRGKNSWKGKDLHCELILHVGVWGGSLEIDLQS